MSLLAAIMTYVMAEVGFATWLPSYVVQVSKLTLTEGAFCLSGFYLIFTLGRLSAHWWMNRIGQEKAVMISSTAAIVTLGIAMSGNRATLALFIVARLCFSVIFPTIASIACHVYADHAGKVLGYLFTASGIGAMLGNGIIGLLANHFGLKAGFSVILFFLGCVLICMWFVIRLNKSAVLAVNTGERLER